MAGVRQALNQMKSNQETLTVELDDINDKIKAATTQNYELEKEKLSLERQEILLKQKIASISLLEQQKLDKIKKLGVTINSSESSDSLSAKSDDIDKRKDELLEQLKEVRDKANKMDMEYEGLQKRVLNLERNRDSTIQRALKKEAEAKRLEDRFASVTSQVQIFKSKDDVEDGDLTAKVEELQQKLHEATTAFEIAERENSSHDQLVKKVTAAIQKQREENDKIRKEMDALNAELGT